MPKSDLELNGGDYAPVAERIMLFYARHPSGRILTDLVSRADGWVVFKASVYQSTAEGGPAATGWAAEREDDGEINAVACVENTETSAVGRALANLGYTAGRRPSYEEMRKAARARSRRDSATGGPTSNAAGPASVEPVQDLDSPAGDLLQERADALTDVLRLIDAAEGEGMPAAQAEALRAEVTAAGADGDASARISRQVRRWLADSRMRRLGPERTENE